MKKFKGVIPNYNIYFCTINDILNYIQDSSLKDIINEDYIFHGFIKKYFPLIENYLSIKKPTKAMKDYKNKMIKKLKILENHKLLEKEEFFCEITECRSDILIYKNRIQINSLNLFKIFKEFELSSDVPYMRIYIDSYLESYIKFYKESIYSEYNKDKE